MTDRRSRTLVLVALLAVALLAATAVTAGDRLQRQARATVGPQAASTPAPPGPSPTAWRVVALGDSVTAGTACDCTSFPQLYAAGLGRERGAGVTVDNRGVSGDTSADLLDDLGHGATADAVARADVVLVTIGANDVVGISDDVLGGHCGDGSADDLHCARSRLSTLRSTLDAILARIASLRFGRPTAVLVTTYWNVYEDGTVADRDYSAGGKAASDDLTRAVNGIITAAATSAGVLPVDLYRPFRGLTGETDPSDLLADDGDHPNAAGHRLIARTLLAAGLAPLGGAPPRAGR